ncbi:MAG TPA: glycosyltransferase, partial [Gillisia sp.]|nr:glycosyltransferase [Gillisia sp.]
GAGNTGLHNILEPAAFGVPVVIGKNFQKFPEAIQLQSMGGLFSVDSAKEIQQIFNLLLKDEDLRKQCGAITGQFIQKNTGADRIVEAYLTAKDVKNP